jgi:hypothetical protein
MVMAMRKERELDEMIEKAQKCEVIPSKNGVKTPSKNEILLGYMGREPRLFIQYDGIIDGAGNVAHMQDVTLDADGVFLARTLTHELLDDTDVQAFIKPSLDKKNAAKVLLKMAQWLMLEHEENVENDGQSFGV